MSSATFHTLRLTDQGLELLDQRVLPHEKRYLLLETGEEVARAIEDMVVRGAPAIGDTAAMGVAIELGRAPDGALEETLRSVCARLRRTRPTAVNLAWALTGRSASSGRCSPRVRATPRFARLPASWRRPSSTRTWRPATRSATPDPS